MRFILISMATTAPVASAAVDVVDTAGETALPAILDNRFVYLCRSPRTSVEAKFHRDVCFCLSAVILIVR